jgi:hypothetical protein
MIDHPYSTLWETFPCDGTPNHGWAGGPLYVLSAYVAGVRPVAPGYDRYLVEPRPGDLSWLKADVPSVRGTIRVEWDGTDPACRRLLLRSPQGTAAAVGVPVPGPGRARVEANGTVVYDAGSPTDTVSGLRLVEAEADRVWFEADPGEWRFTAR